MAHEHGSVNGLLHYGTKPLPVDLYFICTSSVTYLRTISIPISEVNKFKYFSKCQQVSKYWKVSIPCNSAFAWNCLKNWWLAALWYKWLSQSHCSYSSRFGSSARTIFVTENQVCSSYHEPVVKHSSFSSGCYMAWERNLLWWQSISTTPQHQCSVGRMVRYYFALAYKMVKMSKSAFLLQMEVSQSEKLS